MKLVEELAHPGSRDHGQKSGGSDQHQGGRDEESVHFAKDLGAMLTTAHAQSRFGDLILIADPRFLGMLRSQLAATVETSVSRSIPKHAVQMKPPELEKLLAHDA